MSGALERRECYGNARVGACAVESFDRGGREVGTRSAAVTLIDGKGRDATEGKQGRSESTLSKERRALGPADTYMLWTQCNYTRGAYHRGTGVCTTVYKAWTWTCVVAEREPGALIARQREREGVDFVTPP